MIMFPFVVVIVALLLFKVFIKLTIGFDNSYTCLVGKTVIVTGSNGGKPELLLLCNVFAITMDRKKLEHIVTKNLVGN